MLGNTCWCGQQAIWSSPLKSGFGFFDKQVGRVHVSWGRKVVGTGVFQCGEDLEELF
jgi:hypothetical protein